MKFKYISSFLVLMLTSGAVTFAQKGAFDLSLGVGYGFKSTPYTEVSESSGSAKNISYSMGSGFNGDISGTYMLSEHIGAGLNLNYVTGSKAEYSRMLIGSGAYTTTTLKGTLMAATPNITVSANREGINPYGRFGIVLGSANVTSTTTESDNSVTNYVLKYSGNIAMGWYAGVGLQYSLSDKFLLNAEVFNRSMAYAPKTAENTQNSGGQKEPTITFAKSTDHSSSSYTENQVYFPFSSVGIMVGITIRLGGAAK